MLATWMHTCNKRIIPTICINEMEELRPQTSETIENLKFMMCFAVFIIQKRGVLLINPFHSDQVFLFLQLVNP